jgi:prefoldin subunit 5
MKNLESEIEFLKTKIESLETHLEELKQYYFTTRELDGLIIKYHSERLHKLDNSEF